MVLDSYRAFPLSYQTRHIHSFISKSPLTGHDRFVTFPSLTWIIALQSLVRNLNAWSFRQKLQHASPYDDKYMIDRLNI